jgi:hypothetical protein
MSVAQRRKNDASFFPSASVQSLADLLHLWSFSPGFYQEHERSGKACCLRKSERKSLSTLLVFGRKGIELIVRDEEDTVAAISTFEGRGKLRSFAIAKFEFKEMPRGQSTSSSKGKMRDRNISRIKARSMQKNRAQKKVKRRKKIGRWRKGNKRKSEKENIIKREGEKKVRAKDHARDTSIYTSKGKKGIPRVYSARKVKG